YRSDFSHAGDTDDGLRYFGTEACRERFAIEPFAVRRADEHCRAHRCGVEPQSGNDGGSAERPVEPGRPIARSMICIELARGIEGRCDSFALIGRVRRTYLLEPGSQCFGCRNFRRGVQNGNHVCPFMMRAQPKSTLAPFYVVTALATASAMVRVPRSVASSSR